MKQRTIVGLGLIVAGLGIVAGATRRGRGGSRFFTGPLFEDALIPGPLFEGGLFGDAGTRAGTTFEIDAAPLLVIRGAFNDVEVVTGDGPRVSVSAPDVGDIRFAVHARRVDDGDGAAVVLNLVPRRRIAVTAPRGTAIRLRVAKSRCVVSGFDDVDVQSAKSKIVLRDVAGDVRIRSGADAIEIELSHERETRSVDIAAARAHLTLAVPASRGGDYRLTAANSSVSAPPSVSGGIPVTIRAARSKVAVRTT